MTANGLLIFPQWLVTSALESPKENYGIRVLGDTIDAVALQEELRAQFPDDEIIEKPGQVLLPGFVDAHTHLYGLLAHGIPLKKAPEGFMPFLEDFWWPLVENQLDIDLIKAATAWNCSQMIDSGITSFYDCTEAPHALPGVLLEQAHVVEKWGLRGILSFEATERISPENGDLGLYENLEMISYGRKTGGTCPRINVFPHNFYLFRILHQTGIRSGSRTECYDSYALF